MYEAYYKLQSAPFQTAPDPDFLYWSDAHANAFAVLQYGMITHAQITVVTGEIGAGKTTLLRHMLRQMPAGVTVGLVSNIQAGKGELLHWILMALDQDFRPDEPYVALFRRLQDVIIDAYAAGNRVVLVFDEAQNFSVEMLEELRMLSNINAEKNDLLQIVLVGQPQLRALIARPELIQFAQRIGADFHLSALNPADVADYIAHRLDVAGAQWRIFPPGTCQLIARATRGVPRMVNILCDLCLTYGFAADSRVIHEELLLELLTSARRNGVYTQFADVGQSVDAPAIALHKR